MSDDFSSTDILTGVVTLIFIIGLILVMNKHIRNEDIKFCRDTYGIEWRPANSGYARYCTNKSGEMRGFYVSH